MTSLARQRTLAGEAVFEGVGLHGGEKVRCVVRPAAPDSGYAIRAEGAVAPIRPERCDGQGYCNRIRISEDVSVSTVEHLLAALRGSDIDNALIEVEGGEAPGLDGSAREFVLGIEKAGAVEQEAQVRPIRLRAPVAVGDAASGLTAYPAADGRLRVTYILDYPESALARGVFSLSVSPDSFRDMAAPARTFVLKAHAEAMRERGFGKGADVRNTVVLDGDRALDAELRFPDECARHKALDLIGDLATLGRRLSAHVVAVKSGHALNIRLARALAAEAWRTDYPKGVMDIRGIESRLPHRYPFLLVDRVLEFEASRRIVTIKNVTRNEEFFEGHFPRQPIMPGVLQVEALAQSGALLFADDPAVAGKLAVLMAVEDVKYRRPVVPGDQIVMEAELEKFKGRIGVVKAKSMVEGEAVVECRIKFALVDPEQYG